MKDLCIGWDLSFEWALLFSAWVLNKNISFNGINYVVAKGIVLRNRCFTENIRPFLFYVKTCGRYTIDINHIKVLLYWTLSVTCHFFWEIICLTGLKVYLFSFLYFWFNLFLANIPILQPLKTFVWFFQEIWNRNIDQK